MGAGCILNDPALWNVCGQRLQPLQIGGGKPGAGDDEKSEIRISLGGDTGQGDGLEQAKAFLHAFLAVEKRLKTGLIIVPHLETTLPGIGEPADPDRAHAIWPRKRG